jgi:hypothetical protein
VRRTVVAAMGMVVVGCWVGMPAAAADKPACAATVCSFYSPSRIVGCEINYQRDGIPDETYCQTMSPPQSVHMSASGVLTNCTGDSCLGNAGLGTPTLAAGQTAGIGPFSCLMQASGVTCTVPSGRGFTISGAGITPVG